MPYDLVQFSDVALSSPRVRVWVPHFPKEDDEVATCATRPREHAPKGNCRWLKVARRPRFLVPIGTMPFAPLSYSSLKGWSSFRRHGSSLRRWKDSVE